MGIDSEHMEQFRRYKKAMLEEAKSFLERKEEFLQTTSFSLDYKLLRLSELVDFFILEGEDQIARELADMALALRVKKIMMTSWLAPGAE